MISKDDMNQVDRLLENTFPAGSIPPNGAASKCAGEQAAPASHSSSGAVPAPAAPVSLPRAEQIQELGKLCERVKLLGEEMERTWQTIIAAQQAAGWPDFHLVQGITHDLHRTTAELDGRTFEMVCKLRWRPA